MAEWPIAEDCKPSIRRFESDLHLMVIKEPNYFINIFVREDSISWEIQPRNTEYEIITSSENFDSGESSERELPTFIVEFLKQVKSPVQSPSTLLKTPQEWLQTPWFRGLTISGPTGWDEGDVKTPVSLFTMRQKVSDSNITKVS